MSSSDDDVARSICESSSLLLAPNHDDMVGSVSRRLSGGYVGRSVPFQQQDREEIQSLILFATDSQYAGSFSSI